MELTAQKEKATGEKGPATALELGTYTIAEFQPHKPRRPAEILRPPSLLCMHVSHLIRAGLPVREYLKQFRAVGGETARVLVLF